LSLLVSVKLERSIVGPALAALLATAGVVGDGVPAEEIGIMPGTPPKAPGIETGVGAAASPVLGRITVLLSELARAGRAVGVDADVAADPSETGAPTIGRDVESVAPLWVASDVDAATDVAVVAADSDVVVDPAVAVGSDATVDCDVAVESPGGGTSPDWLVSP
jgi:hypothetical protein